MPNVTHEPIHCSGYPHLENPQPTQDVLTSFACQVKADKELFALISPQMRRAVENCLVDFESNAGKVKSLFNQYGHQFTCR